MHTFIIFLVANQWKEKFEEARNIVKTECSLYKDDYKDATKSSDDESDDSEAENEDPPTEKPQECSEKQSDVVDKDEKTVIQKLSELDVKN